MTLLAPPMRCHRDSLRRFFFEYVPRRFVSKKLNGHHNWQDLPKCFMFIYWLVALTFLQ